MNTILTPNQPINLDLTNPICQSTQEPKPSNPIINGTKSFGTGVANTVVSMLVVSAVVKLGSLASQTLIQRRELAKQEELEKLRLQIEILQAQQQINQQ